MLLRIESKDCCILLAHAVPLANGRTQMGFVYSSGRKSQFQLCLRFFICLIWFICHLSSLQRHFIMVSWCQFICQQTRLLFLIVHIPGTMYETAGCRSHSGDLNQQNLFFLLLLLMSGFTGVIYPLGIDLLILRHCLILTRESWIFIILKENGVPCGTHCDCLFKCLYRWRLHGRILVVMFQGSLGGRGLVWDTNLDSYFPP
jgi:hypothetical protein